MIEITEAELGEIQLRLAKASLPDISAAPMRPADPKHGVRVFYGRKTHTERDEEGRIVSISTETVTEQWCAHCKTWIQTNGVLGPLRFMAYHEHGACTEDTHG